MIMAIARNLHLKLDSFLKAILNFSNPFLNPLSITRTRTKVVSLPLIKQLIGQFKFFIRQAFWLEGSKSVSWGTSLYVSAQPIATFLHESGIMSGQLFAVTSGTEGACPSSFSAYAFTALSVKSRALQLVRVYHNLSVAALNNTLGMSVCSSLRDKQKVFPFMFFFALSLVCIRKQQCKYLYSVGAEPYTVTSRLADTSLLRTFAITDKIQIPGKRGLTGNYSRYYGLSLLRTLNDVPRVFIATTVNGKNHVVFDNAPLTGLIVFGKCPHWGRGMRMNEGSKEGRKEGRKEGTNERMKERTSERTNERTNENE